MSKLKIEKLVECINYYDEMPIFIKRNGDVLTDEDLINLGLTEDDYPFDIKEFKKLGLGFSGVTYDCQEGDRIITYNFDKNNNMVVIESDSFTIKECFIIIDMIRKQLQAVGSGDFISFGNDEEDTHILYHEESTAYGVWWEDFYNLFMSRTHGENKMKKIFIFTEDYQTDEEGWYTKDRVIHIVLE